MRIRDSASRTRFFARGTHDKPQNPVRPPSDCAVQAHFVDDFDVSASRRRGIASACMQTARPYLPIDYDDLCRSHGRCIRDALLSRASSAGWLTGWLLSQPRSRIDRYYFRPVHGTRWIHNALPRARRNAPIIIMRARFTCARARLTYARSRDASRALSRLALSLIVSRIVVDDCCYLSV